MQIEFEVLPNAEAEYDSSLYTFTAPEDGCHIYKNGKFVTLLKKGESINMKELIEGKEYHD